MPQNHSFVEAAVQSSRDLTFPRRTCFWEAQKSIKNFRPDFTIQPLNLMKIEHFLYSRGGDLY